MIKRKIEEKIKAALFKGRVIVIYGPRQAGKTTLVKDILRSLVGHTSRYVNCDEPDVRRALEYKTSTEMRSFLGDIEVVVLDEAQRISDIGLTLKLLVDTFPEVQIIATGSSSFELANKINEPLTGRKEEFFLPPLSFSEFANKVGDIDARRLLELRLVYGMYPKVVTSDREDAAKRLQELARSYVFKDILSFDHIKNPEVLEKLLTALALQVGNEVSYTELARLVGVSKHTVENYVRILEQAFIIFRVGPWSRNLRTELRKLKKIYFWDTGVRNALINNLNMFPLRQDVGAIWENFLVSERMKKYKQDGMYIRPHFWRTHQQQEIDYIEESDGVLRAFEFKWKDKTWKPPKSFVDAYPDAKIALITSENYQDFIF